VIGDRRTVIAVAAHPDDIEFVMAGTLWGLKEKGWNTHYLNISSGNCGSQVKGPEETGCIRGAESRDAANILGAIYHEPFSRDLEILYDLHHLRRLAAILHEVAPDIVLTHSPEDYMEDHMITSRLAVTAAFTHSMPNFETDPPMAPPNKEVTVYHAMPHGLCDGLRQKIVPDCFVDVSDLRDLKIKALSAHQSQQSWLDASQGLNSYLHTMDDQDRKVGRLSGKFEFAEGWRRHFHLGFNSDDCDPLADALGKKCSLDHT
jgi:LmbE family N-acetylglucosaminyl deacetylase